MLSRQVLPPTASEQPQPRPRTMPTGQPPHALVDEERSNNDHGGDDDGVSLSTLFAHLMKLGQDEVQ